MQSVVSIAYNKIREPLVDVDNLWDLSSFQQFREMVDFGSNSVVVICQLMSSRLQVFALVGNVGVNAFVLFAERTKLVAELGCTPSSLYFNLTCDSLELIDILWTIGLLNCQKLYVERILVGFLQECY